MAIHPRHTELAIVLTAALTAPAIAHSFSITEVNAALHDDGSYVIDMQVDLDALALGVSPALDSAALAAELKAMPPDEFAQARQRARDAILHRVRVRFDGVHVTPEISFPEENSQAEPERPPSVLGVTARLTGRAPPGARMFTFGASRAFQNVALTIRGPGSVVGTQYQLEASQDSPPFPIRPATRPPQHAAQPIHWGAVIAVVVAIVVALGWGRTVRAAGRNA